MRRWLLLLASVVLALGLGEIVARLALRVPSVGPSLTEYDPAFGRVHKRSFRGTRRTPEFEMTFSTNAEGLRGPERARANDGGPEVLCIGDSFTEGYGVNDGEEFPRLLERALDGAAPVVNAGVGAVGTGWELKFLRRWAREHNRPTVLVFQFCANDFDDNSDDGLFRLGADDELVELPPPAPCSAMRRLQPALEAVPGLVHSHLFGAVAAVAALAASRPANGVHAADVETDADRLTRALLHACLDEARGRGWPTLAIVFGLGARRERDVCAVASESGTRIVKLPSKRERPDLYYHTDDHWNRAGHALAAAELAPAVSGALASLRTRR